MMSWPKRLFQFKADPVAPEILQLREIIPCLSRRTAYSILARFPNEQHHEIVNRILQQHHREELITDPIEEMEEFSEAFRNAELDTNERLEEIDRDMGFCHLYWTTKQQILLEEYGIEWFTPGQMNPGMFFD